VTSASNFLRESDDLRSTTFIERDRRRDRFLGDRRRDRFLGDLLVFIYYIDKKKMGLLFADQYSLLHFSVGVVAYFWGIDFVTFFVLHSIFEVLENTQTGIFLIQHVPVWPGKKLHSDSTLNILGDTFFALAGFDVARRLDDAYKD
jgi:hypothetical protein